MCRILTGKTLKNYNLYGILLYKKGEESKYLTTFYFYLMWTWLVGFCPGLALFLQYLKAIQLTLQYNFHRLQTRHEPKIHMKITVLPFFLSSLCCFLTFGQIFILYSKDNMQNGVKLFFEYSRVWNRPSPWNKRSPSLTSFSKINKHSPTFIPDSRVAILLLYTVESPNSNR